MLPQPCAQSSWTRGSLQLRPGSHLPRETSTLNASAPPSAPSSLRMLTWPVLSSSPAQSFLLSLTLSACPHLGSRERLLACPVTTDQLCPEQTCELLWAELHLLQGDLHSSLLFLFIPLVMSDSLGTSWTAAQQTLTISRSLSEFMSIESVMPFNGLNLCCPLLLLPSIFPSIRVFCNEFSSLGKG